MDIKATCVYTKAGAVEEVYAFREDETGSRPEDIRIAVEFALEQLKTVTDVRVVTAVGTAATLPLAAAALKANVIAGTIIGSEHFRGRKL